MNKNTLILLIVGVLIIVGGFSYWFYQPGTVNMAPKEVTIDPKNCTYVIEGQNITLKNGYSEEQTVVGSASKNITQYFGNEVSADFNGDGIKDTAFILTQNSGGSGTFYYIAAALSSKNGCVGTNAFSLGDRIAPQTTEFNNGEIIVNYADRKVDEPMSATPTIGVSKYLKISNGNLIEVIKSSTQQPSIISIVHNPATVGSIVIVTGTNLSGFEGDKNLWIENSAGQKGIIYGERDSSNTTIKFTLASSYCATDNSYSGAPCPSYITIIPGTYDIYALPWGNMSNKMTFGIVAP